MRATASLLVLLMIGCSTHISTRIPTKEPATDASTSVERPMPDPFLPTRDGTESLSGLKVVSSDSGAWTIRITKSPEKVVLGFHDSTAEKVEESEERKVFYDFADEVAPGEEGFMGEGSGGLGFVGTASGGGGGIGGSGSVKGTGSGGSGGGKVGTVKGMGRGDAKMKMSVRAPSPSSIKPGRHKSYAALSSARPAPPAQALKAGSTDDNEKFEDYLSYLEAWFHGEKEMGHSRFMNVKNRRFIKVEDASGRPVPGALVQVVDEAADEVIWETYTYGDGRAPLYLSEENLSAAGYLVEVVHDGKRSRDRWDGRGSAPTFSTGGDRNLGDAVALDVVFLIDTTGSMSDEIERIKTTLLSVTEKLRSLEMEFDLRYGAVLYRDVGDAYVTKLHPFTSDIAAFDLALKDVQANGGGDGPESLNQGLFEAVHGVRWRGDAAKLVFLIADAEPHSDYEGDVAYPDVLRDAVSKGIKVHSVAASGLSSAGTVVFRQVAQYTRGEFIFIEYGGSIKATAEWHGVKGEVKSNNLDDILYDKIQEEVALYGSDGSR